MSTEDIKSRDGLPEGFVEVEGLAAAEDAADTSRVAALGGPDPLDGLAKRIIEEKQPELAFDPAVLGAALDLEVEDSIAFAALRRELKAAGVTITPWTKALDRVRAVRKAAAKAANEKAAREAAILRRQAQEQNAADRAAEVLAKRAAADEDGLSAHYAEKHINGATYFVSPGAMWMEEFVRNDLKRTQLTTFSAPIVRNVLELDMPDAAPVKIHVASIFREGWDRPRELDIAPKDLVRGEIDPDLPPGCNILVGMSQRNHVRVAMMELASPEETWRFGYTGWRRDGSRWVYLHAGGAIGAEGVVPGVDVRIGDPVGHFRLPPPPSGQDLADARDALLELLSLEPASAVVPVVAQAFRAALGNARCSLHVYGSPRVGKSTLGMFGQMFFSTHFDEDTPPLSWRGEDTRVAMLDVIARAGDCVMLTDDLKRSANGWDPTLMKAADLFFSSIFGHKGRHKGKREGRGIHAGAPPRSVALSTGEVLPRAGASLVQRLLPVLLSERMTGDVPGLRSKGKRGVFAKFMSAFLRWVAPRRDQIAAQLEVRDAKAAEAWGLGADERAVKLLGALATGMRALFAFLRELGTDEGLLAHHEARAVEALRAASTRYDEVSEEQGAADLFMRLLRDAVDAKRCYLTSPVGEAPERCHLWGWRPSDSTGTRVVYDGDEREEVAPKFVPGRADARIGWVDPGGEEVYLTPSAAFLAVQRYAQELGEVVNIDPSDLPRQLFDRGLLARHERDVPTRRTYLCRKRVNGMLKTGLLCLRAVDVLGADSDVSGVPPRVGKGEHDFFAEESMG